MPSILPLNLVVVCFKQKTFQKNIKKKSPPHLEYFPPLKKFYQAEIPIRPAQERQKIIKKKIKFPKIVS